MNTSISGAFAPTVKVKAAPVSQQVKEVRKVLGMFPDLSNIFVQVTDGAVFVSDGYAMVRLTGGAARAMEELCEANGSPDGGSFAGRRSGEPVKVWHSSTARDLAMVFERGYLLYKVATCERVAAADATTYADGLVRCTADDTVAILDAARAVRLGATGAMVSAVVEAVRLTNAHGETFALLMPVRNVAVAEEVAL